MLSIYENITQIIGKTPLVRLDNAFTGCNTTLLAKLESFNPLHSVKDRLGLALIEAGEKSGELKQNSTILEATSGNTGIALAFIAAAKRYKAIFTMPDSTSIERRKIMLALGAETVLTPGKLGMKGSLEEARKIKEAHPDFYMPNQFEHPANAEMHRRTTGVEIWDATQGAVDIFVAGVGTGGTITGVGEKLKTLKKTVQIIAVEPDSSPVLSGGAPGPHPIQGIGAGFVPKILNTKIYDEIIRVSINDAESSAKNLAKKQGIFAGISSGAALWAALTVCNRPENKGKTVVVMLPDTGERYLSTNLYNS